jgi:hypothetical protein
MQRPQHSSFKVSSGVLSEMTPIHNNSNSNSNNNNSSNIIIIIMIKISLTNTNSRQLILAVPTTSSYCPNKLRFTASNMVQLTHSSLLPASMEIAPITMKTKILSHLKFRLTAILTNTSLLVIFNKTTIIPRHTNEANTEIIKKDANLNHTNNTVSNFNKKYRNR